MRKMFAGLLMSVAGLSLRVALKIHPETVERILPKLKQLFVDDEPEVTKDDWTSML